MNRSRDESSSSGVSVASSNGGKSKRNKSNSNVKPPNPNSVETVRMIMKKEGRSARNLVSWSIPFASYSSTKGKSSKPRRINNSQRSAQQPPINVDRSNSGERPQKRAVTSSRQAASTTRKPMNIRARYWAYLFENLRRAVDEIYTTCEGDASVVECKEVLLILDNYRHDFQALIDWIHLQEKLENTDIHERPTSLAWEVRKSSPGRPRQKMVPRGVTPGSAGSAAGLQGNKINRKASAHNTEAPKKIILASSQNLTQQTNNTTTWADRVKGVKPATTSQPIVTFASNPTEVTVVTEDPDPNKEDGEWETVTSRNRQGKHSKLLKNVPEEKISATATKKETVPIPHRLKSSPVSSSNLKLSDVSQGGSGYVNVVVDRIIGLGAMTSPTSTNNDTNVSEASDTGKVGNGGGAGSEENALHHDVILEETNNEVQRENELQSEKQRGVEDEDGNDDVFTDAEENKENNEVKKEVLTQESIDEEEPLLSEIDVASLAYPWNRLHEEHDMSIAVAEEQERDLLRQIREVENAKEQYTPELDTDCDSAQSSAGARELSAIEKALPIPMEWSDFVARFEVEQQAGLSWNELVEQEELREPGRAVQMHEKLSSPSRKRTPAESKRKQEEKHRRAEARRLQMHQEKTQKIHELTEKVQEVVNWKNDLIRRQRDLLQSFHAEKLARAEEQRAIQLLHIKKKAQAEDTKVNEIAFINELQEQNKRHEVLMRIGEHESRIQELELERTKMQEMKYFKEESVKERRRALERERLDRIEELKVKRKEQDARIEQQKIEKEKEREKQAKERAREREQRISALNAAQQEAVSELQKKIQLKHDESLKRHHFQLEQRKEKAAELSLGRFSTLTSSLSSPATSTVTSTTPLVAATSVTSTMKLTDGAVTELTDLKAHIGGENEDKLATDENANHLVNGDLRSDCKLSTSSGSISSPRSNAGHTDEESKEDEAKIQERKKVMKKRAKKLRNRMTARGKEFMKRYESRNISAPVANKNKVVRLIKDVNRLLNQKGNRGPWPTNRVSSLDRALGEINRILEKQVSNDQLAFRIGGGFEMLESVFEIFLMDDTAEECGMDEGGCILPDKSLSIAAITFRTACNGNDENCIFALYASKLSTVVDLTLSQTSKNAPSPKSKKTDGTITYDVASPALLSVMAVVFHELCHQPPNVSTTYKSTDMVAMASTNDGVKVVETYLNRGLDVISYFVASGSLEILSRYLKSIRHEVAPESNMAAFVKHGLSFLKSITSFVSMRHRLLADRSSAHGPSPKKRPSSDRAESACRAQLVSDPTQLLPTLQQTELMGIVSVLYGLLFHGALERPTTLRSASVDNNLAAMNGSELKQIPKHTLSIARAVMSVLNAVAGMDLELLQASLGEEGLSLAFRHICTYLLWYCVQGDHTELLHEVIICVGHFTLRNQHNQDLVDSGAQPTVLQQLCVLPFSYFSNPYLMHILFPTLISCCYGNDSNLNVLEQEANSSLLVAYIQTLMQDGGAKGDGDTKGVNKTKKVTENLPRSLTDATQFNAEFLQQALAYFSEEHVINDVNTHVETSVAS